MAGGDDWIVVGGHSIHITNPGRILYPTEAITKAAVIAYYVQVAARVLPHLRRRPITRVRWPQGVEAAPFFEKQLPSHAPEWMDRVTFDHSDGPITYPMATEAASLVWFAQQNALELHVPQWRVRGTDTRTDRLVLDLDPGPGTGLPQCAEIALWLRTQLESDDLAAVPVTSGSKGLHVYARWRASRRLGSPSDYAKTLASKAEGEFPALVTATMAKRERHGKVLIDWSQNNPAKTTVTPYSLRGQSSPLVAAPRDWAELDSAELSQLTMMTVLERLTDPDPLAVVL